MRKILIATPLKGEIPARYVSALISTLTKKIDGVQFGYCFLEGPAVQQARNEIADYVLAHGYDEVIQIDKDILYDEKIIERMVSHEDQEIVCALYSKRSIHTHWHIQGIEGELLQSNGLLKVKQCAVGLSKIRRDVFEKMKEKYPERSHVLHDGGDQPKTIHEFYPMGIVDGNYLGEDYYFCKLAREAGFDIWLDTQLIVRHLAQVALPIPTEDLLKMIDEPWRAEEVKAIKKI